MSRSVRALASFVALLQPHSERVSDPVAHHSRPHGVLVRLESRTHRLLAANKWFPMPNVVACKHSCNCTCWTVNQQAALHAKDVFEQTAGLLSRPALRASSSSLPRDAACDDGWQHQLRNCAAVCAASSAEQQWTLQSLCELFSHSLPTIFDVEASSLEQQSVLHATRMYVGPVPAPAAAQLAQCDATRQRSNSHLPSHTRPHAPTPFTNLERRGTGHAR